MPDRRVFVAVFALFVAFAGTWAGAHFVRPLAEPKWTTADLPALPPESDNVYALLDRRVTVPEMDELIVDETHEVTDVIAEARERRLELVEALAPTEELRAAIRRRPRFVEAGGMLGRPHVMEGMAIWRLRSLSVLLALLEHRHDAAAEEVASMWTHAVDYSSHCQSMVSCMAAQRLLQLTLGSADLLMETSPHDLRWLGRLLESSVLDRSAISSGIIAEYVYARVMLETYDAPLLDRAHTDTMLADYFDTALHFARDPSRARPVADFRGSPLWWTYNPAGKRLAAGATVAHLDDLIERYGRAADAIEDRRVELARRATYRAPLELAGEDAGAMPALHSPEPLGSGEGE